MGKKRGKKSKSLAGKLGKQLQEAHEEHKDDEIKVSSGGSLPSGINGIARLTECKFDTYEKGDNEGEYFFYAHGVVLKPKMHNGVKVQGKLTQIGPEPICDTPSKGKYKRKRETLADHIDWVYNELRKLGVDTSDIDPDDLEDIANTLKEEQPVFAFHTWGGPTKERPDNRVRSEWEGIVEDYEEEDEDDGVEDEDEDEDDEDEDDENDEDENDEDEDDEDEDDEGEDDLEQLAKDADSKKKSTKRTEARTRLTELAEANELDTEDYDTWADVAEAIEEASGEDEDEDDDEGEETRVPKKKDICKVKGLRSEYQVETVNKTKETVNLKSVKSGKPKKNVSWDDLVWEDDED